MGWIIMTALTSIGMFVTCIWAAVQMASATDIIEATAFSGCWFATMYVFSETMSDVVGFFQKRKRQRDLAVDKAFEMISGE